MKMAWFLYLISATWIAFGSCTILYTTETKMTAKTFISKIPPKFLAAIPFISGILFILAASASSHPGIIRMLGVIALLKGIFVFVNPANLRNKTMDWFLVSLSDQAHRIIGILSIILGTALLSWIL
jgi:uncharacterized protein YjeT (DUF2065 family)